MLLVVGFRITQQNNAMLCYGYAMMKPKYFMKPTDSAVVVVAVVFFVQRQIRKVCKP